MAATPLGPRPAAPPRQGLAIASLVVGVLSIPTCGGLVVGALTALVLGIVALVRSSRDASAYGGRGFAIGGIVASAVSLVVGIPMGGMMAAIVIPSLLKARIAANEAAAIGRIRTVAAAELAYQNANSGFPDTLECLREPSACIPNYSGPAFLGIADTVSPSHGYRFELVLGSAADPSQTAGTRASPSSVTSFAYVASPLAPNQTGVRFFCGDSEGKICAARDSIDASLGRCPADCSPP